MKKLGLVLAAAAVATVGLLSAPVTPAQAQGKTTIGVAFPQDDNPFYIAMLRGVRARAAELGWDVVSVFGYHRFDDSVGLVLQMYGRPVVAMTAGADGKPAEAIIKTGPRSWHICRARVPDGTVLLWRWEEADNDPP